METERIEDQLASLRGELIKAAMVWVQHPADADDLVQGAFVRALEKRDQIPRENLSAWLRTILKHLMIDAWRRQRHELPFDERLAGALESPAPCAWPWWLELSVEDVRAALPHCREVHRRVYEMQVIEGLRPETIAQRLGIAPGTVATRLFRARAEIRQILSKRRTQPPVLRQSRAGHLAVGSSAPDPALVTLAVAA